MVLIKELSRELQAPLSKVKGEKGDSVGPHTRPALGWELLLSPKASAPPTEGFGAPGSRGAAKLRTPLLPGEGSSAALAPVHAAPALPALPGGPTPAPPLSHPGRPRRGQRAGAPLLRRRRPRYLGARGRLCAPLPGLGSGCWRRRPRWLRRPSPGEGLGARGGRSLSAGSRGTWAAAPPARPAPPPWARAPSRATVTAPPRAAAPSPSSDPAPPLPAPEPGAARPLGWGRGRAREAAGAPSCPSAGGASSARAAPPGGPPPETPKRAPCPRAPASASRPCRPPPGSGRDAQEPPDSQISTFGGASGGISATEMPPFFLSRAPCTPTEGSQLRQQGHPLGSAKLCNLVWILQCCTETHCSSNTSRSSSSSSNSNSSSSGGSSSSSSNSSNVACSRVSYLAKALQL
ncbi:uncharacterized protein LOC141522705 [Macrotis lagotis]|uniref:uncharacterized protein LOC141522705 n=1 Tax=Macrotis lagotis TaxID=92651 RepID=UPI003D68FD91